MFMSTTPKIVLLKFPFTQRSAEGHYTTLAFNEQGKSLSKHNNILQWREMHFPLNLKMVTLSAIPCRLPDATEGISSDIPEAPRTLLGRDIG